MLDLTRNELNMLIPLIGSNYPPEMEKVIDNLYQELNLLEETDRVMEDSPYSLSDNQKEFVKDCIRLDLEINWDYSGRNMFGRKCPAVVISDSYLKTHADTVRDSMGMEYVHYAPR